MPGMDTEEPERTATSSGLDVSPKRFPDSHSIDRRALRVWSHIPGGKAPCSS